MKLQLTPSDPSAFGRCSNRTTHLSGSKFKFAFIVNPNIFPASSPNFSCRSPHQIGPFHRPDLGVAGVHRLPIVCFFCLYILQDVILQSLCVARAGLPTRRPTPFDSQNSRASILPRLPSTDRSQEADESLSASERRGPRGRPPLL